MKNKKETDGQTLIRGANEMATLMYDFFASHEEYQSFSMGIVGYATEILLSFFAANIGKPHDELSKEYRKYLGVVHEDVRKFLERQNKNVN